MAVWFDLLGCMFQMLLAQDEVELQIWHPLLSKHMVLAYEHAMGYYLVH